MNILGLISQLIGIKTLRLTTLIPFVGNTIKVRVPRVNSSGFLMVGCYGLGYKGLRVSIMALE